jgi:hypothetical protein
MVMAAEPELSGVADEANEPLERETDPVGVPAEPETEIATLRLCVAVMLLDAGVTVTLGVVTACATVMVAVPDALL